MRDDIINVLKNSNKALTIYELQDALNLQDVKDVKQLSEELRKLEEDVVIYCSNKGRYMMLEDSHLRKGTLRANKKGFGFVEVENMDDDIYIAADNMNGAIHDDIVLIGRDDRSHQRLPLETIIEDISHDKFSLLMDHQPVDLEKNNQLGIDLQVSGHTHGGQIFPVGILSQWLRFGEMNYGYRQLSSMQVIVSSGIAGWGYPLRTGSQSEYVMIHIQSHH